MSDSVEVCLKSNKQDISLTINTINGLGNQQDSCGNTADKLLKRRRRPGEQLSIRYAIFNQCRECNGYEGDQGMTLNQTVWACTEYDCPLWLGRVPENARTGPTVVIPPKPWKSMTCEKCGHVQGKEKVLTPPEWVKTQKLNRKRAVGRFCADCSGGSAELCNVEACHLFEFRRGEA